MGLKELINELCPNGVEYKKLGEVGTFTRGKRFVRDDIKRNGTPCIHYGEIYTFYGISANQTISFLDIEIAKKLRFAESGDVVIVGAGETVEDIGIGVAWLGKTPVAIHDACYIYKHKLNPLFVSYFLRSDNYHSQIKKYVSTGKISSISADGLSKALIPVPPRNIQDEVVKILSAFESLPEVLALELKARNRQKEYYLRKLLSFDEKVMTKKLDDCCQLVKGSTPIQKAIPGEYPMVVTTTNRKSSNQYQFDAPTVCVPLVSSRGHGVACLNQVYYQEGKFALGNILCGITPNNEKELIAEFLFYYLNYKKDVIIVPLMKGGANVSLTVDSLRNIRIPVPSIERQIEIVETIKLFDVLCEKIKAEIKARKKQAKFYYNKAMNFREEG